MLFEQFFVPGLAIASYIVGDEKTGEAAVIDPTRDVEEIIDYAVSNGLHIRHIVETHVHADFVCGSRELRSRLDDNPTLHCSAYGGADWSQPFADSFVSEGDSIDMGDIRFGFQHVPGHTPEHIAISVFDKTRSTDTPWLFFSGDFLFVGDVGRPDLLGEQEKSELARQLYHSVFDRLTSLPDITEVYPAHGAGSLCGKAIGARRSSTLGYERRFSSSLQQKSEDEWVEELLRGMPLSPPYFQRMKRLNQKGPAVIGPDLPGKRRWKAGQVYERACHDCLIVDIRSKEAFAAAHIPNAINIPFGKNLTTWAGWVLPYDRSILLVAEDAAQIGPAVRSLLRVGFDDVRGYLEEGMGSWETSAFPLSMLRTMSVQELDKLRRTEKQLTILDVRTDREWEQGHIDEAVHIHGGVLQDRTKELPRDKPMAVVCGSGYRASIASSFLKRNGFDDVTNVIGGMSAWKQADLPTSVSH